MRPYSTLLLAGALIAAAQTPTFEAASVKPNNSGDPTIMLRPFQAGGRADFTNIPLNILLQRAYGVQNFQISGGPGWIASDRFDIVAKTPANTSVDQLTAMLRALLEDRFKLALHRETRELPIYALVVPRADGKLKMQRSEADCAAMMTRPGPPIGPPAPNERPVCGMNSTRPGQILAGGLTMADLARRLSQILGRVVEDHTMLTGGFDFDLEWTPDQPPPLLGPQAPGYDPNGPSLFVAVQEQLGLKLEARKGPVDVLVIDHVEKPEEN